MTFLPIVERELRVRARQRGTYWARFLVALLGTTICFLESPYGRNMFESLVTVAFLWCCFAFVLTADVISSERREKTLGLLFLTRVKAPDVLLGKLTSAGLTAFCGLVGVLPVLMLPVLSGGVNGGEVFRTGLVLLNTLFLALASGLWASTRTAGFFRAGRVALGILVVILLGPLAINQLATFGGFIPRNTFGLLSPVVGLLAGRDLAYRASSMPYWISLLAVQLLAWSFVVWTAVRLRRSLQETTSDEVAVPVARRQQTRITGITAPIGWLVSRQKGIRLMIWVAVGFSCLSFVSGYLFPLALGTSAMAIMWPLHLVQGIVTGGLFAWAASRFFMEARRTGELELLVTTPLGAETIVSEQWSALWRILRWPLAVLLLPLLAQTATMWTSVVMRGNGLWEIPYTFSMLFWFANTILEVLVLSWLGIWYGLISRTQTGAIVSAVAWAKGVPLIAGLASLLVFRMIPGILGSGNSLGLVASWLPQVAILGYYLWLLRRVRRRLHGELREAKPMLAGSEMNVSTIWKRGLRLVQNARHWTPGDSR